MDLIHNLSRTDLVDFCLSIDQPRYRADQIWDWLYVKRVSSWDDMKNVPPALRDELSDKFVAEPVSLGHIDGKENETRKVLAVMRDEEQVEEVLLQDGDRKTVCISCQAGCKFNCAFCASGQAGFIRDLEAGEMVGQFLLAEKIFESRINNLVFMGMGEPFDNYDSVLQAARIVNDDKGINLGARRITISTSGIIPGIEKLADEGIQVELSVSLHAPEDSLRTSLMPVNSKYPLKDLIAACKAYTDRTSRIITFEYTMIKGLNDTSDMADQLANLLRPLHCRVNLIPLSPVDEFEGEPSSPEAGQMFIDKLLQAGVNSTLRNSRGSNIKAACGQLRYRK